MMCQCTDNPGCELQRSDKIDRRRILDSQLENYEGMAEKAPDFADWRNRLESLLEYYKTSLDRAQREFLTQINSALQTPRLTTTLYR